MENSLNEFTCKEVWYILKKLPLTIITKIPFEVRQNITEKSDKCDKELGEIDTSVNLSEMNISEDAKEVLNSLYLDYLSSDEIKDKLQEYIDFCNKKNN